MNMQTAIPTNDVKQQFITAALTLFAENGVQSVSMRHINRAIGTKNNSAAHYHFGNKEGLVEAVMLFIQDWFESQRFIPLTQLESQATDGPITIEEVLEVWARPYLNLVQTEEWGFDALRLLARVQLEQDSFSREMHFAKGKKLLDRLRALALAALPHLPEEIVLNRLSYCALTFVQGIAINGFLAKDQASDPANALEALFHVSLRYNVAGMKAENLFAGNEPYYPALKELHILF
jgi:AcrR family transcriptional regulator